MNPLLNFDKFIIAFKIQKLERGKFLVYGISTDLIKQGDYVNIYSSCSNERIICGFVRRIYFGSLANSEVASSFPGEEHTFLIIKDEIYYRQNPAALENYRILAESENKGVFDILYDFIAKSKSILKEKGKTMGAKTTEIRKAASDSFSKIKELKIPQALKNKITEKIKKLVSYFTSKDKSSQQPPTLRN